ncbi:hypothetical protein VNO77_41704 [Canavalia gladiata]|uniref:Uncharacterized protein n=1 Tax=Canavalia gladiata TaxID=3824 RepID=A0AAN9K0A6_CANGL
MLFHCCATLLDVLPFYLANTGLLVPGERVGNKRRKIAAQSIDTVESHQSLSLDVHSYYLSYKGGPFLPLYLWTLREIALEM